MNKHFYFLIIAGVFILNLNFAIAAPYSEGNNFYDTIKKEEMKRDNAQILKDIQDDNKKITEQIKADNAYTQQQMRQLREANKFKKQENDFGKKLQKFYKFLMGKPLIFAWVLILILILMYSTTKFSSY